MVHFFKYIDYIQQHFTSFWHTNGWLRPEIIIWSIEGPQLDEWDIRYTRHSLCHTYRHCVFLKILKLKPMLVLLHVYQSSTHSS